MKTACHFLVFLSVVIFFSVVGCEKDDLVVISSITTLPVTEITDSEAFTGGNIFCDREINPVDYGVCFSTDEYPSMDDHYLSGHNRMATQARNSFSLQFSNQLKSLTPGTKYYIRAFVSTSRGTHYGNQLSFTTLSEQ